MPATISALLGTMRACARVHAPAVKWHHRMLSRCLSGTSPTKKVPVSLLSGFLGSGKTTILKGLLENKGGLRVGVVVNDVASVNIDAKLVRERSSSGIRTKSGEGVEFVELENGCACCNASDELLACILQLLDTAKVNGYTFDRIVIEMSGVAEPKNVRREFHIAALENHPVLDAAELTTMITVVDSPHFFKLYSSKNDVADHEELLGVEGQVSHPRLRPSTPCACMCSPERAASAALRPRAPTILTGDRPPPPPNIPLFSFPLLNAPPTSASQSIPVASSPSPPLPFSHSSHPFSPLPASASSLLPS